MSYRAEFSPEALGDLASLDSVVARRIFAKVSWLGENFENLVPEPLVKKVLYASAPTFR